MTIDLQYRINIKIIERDGSVLTHETRIREPRAQILWLTNLVEVFSGFLNLKIFFKGKCRIGPHIPLLLIQFNVSRDLKPLLSKWLTSNA